MDIFLNLQGIDKTVFLFHPYLYDAFAKSPEKSFFVIPAKAGIQSFQKNPQPLDAGFAPPLKIR
jgi:hypothetical protein